MIQTETQKYRILRGAVGAAMLISVGLVFWLAARSWPIVQQALWPAKYGCACGDVITLAVPPTNAIAAGLVWLATVVMFGRGWWFFGQHILRSRRRLKNWTVSGQRRVWQRTLGEEIVIVNRPGRQAMTMGMFRPQIYITADLLTTLTGSELNAVLRHEQIHRRRFDQLWSAAIDSFSAAWFRLPLWQEWVAASLTLRELSADAGATGEYQRTDGLSGAILKLAGTRPVADIIAFSPNNDRVQKLLDQSWRPRLPQWRWSYGWAMGLAIVTVGLMVRLTPLAVAIVPPAVTRACHETRLFCPRTDEAQVNFFFRQSIPQSVYVLPERAD